MKVRFTITEPLAQHLAALASAEGLSLEDLAQKTIITALLKLEIPNPAVQEKATESAGPLLSVLDRKRMAFLDQQNRKRVEVERQKALADQEKRNRESGEKIKQMVDEMSMGDLKTLLEAVKTKVGA